ncbi:hypothetical protein EUGRSUZ_J01435 [Eucalyptus grandis]|uniref:Uncharacterized protein n=3 Tax=Eucalyptus TaxID=3932 RepID=A0ACC3J5H4_EUCGR|nr:hypothetical protein EUGRSUZ_J01435 [Eucalyptus grandis]
MRATSSASNTHIWSSPIPYLFGGLAVMLILIAVALIILACSYWKRPSNASGDADEKPVKSMIPPLDLEPRIVVILAGDEKPKYLAKPVTSLPSCCEKV